MIVHLIAVAKKGEWICPYCDEDRGGNSRSFYPINDHIEPIEQPRYVDGYCCERCMEPVPVFSFDTKNNNSMVNEFEAELVKACRLIGNYDGEQNGKEVIKLHNKIRSILYTALKKEVEDFSTITYIVSLTRVDLDMTRLNVFCNLKKELTSLIRKNQESRGIKLTNGSDSSGEY